MYNNNSHFHESLCTYLKPCKLAACLLLISAVLLGGCSGVQTFSHQALAGNTIALSLDRQTAYSRADVDVVITDSTNFTQTIPGTDPSIRSWVNTYPDPVSKIIVGRETNQTLGVGALSAAVAAEVQSNGGKDWFTTLVLLDLPTNLATGITTIDVLYNGTSILLSPMTVEIIPGIGTPSDFDTFELGPLGANYLLGIERADHYTVAFSGAVVPAAVEVYIAHDPDKQNAGVGQAFVTQARADINAIHWTDDGSMLHVIITPSWFKTAEDIAATPGNDRQIGWFDFYIAGGITGLQAPVVTAYDANGVQLTGVTATLQ